MQQIDLTALLHAAASGDHTATREFYLQLLDSSLFVPVQSAQPLRLTDNNNICIPTFFTEASALLWAEGKYTIQQRSFKQLIQSTNEHEWILLNPSEELGKELSPWEINTLRQGPESIEELINELDFLPNVEVDVDNSGTTCPRFREQARSILDQYPAITEAFIIRVTTREPITEAPGETSKIMLGWKSEQLSPNKETSLLQELQDLAHNSSELSGGLTIVPDLNQRSNPNVLLFDGATPFYMSPKRSNNLLSRFRALLSRNPTTNND